jgi:hypothetical protein
VNTIDVDERDTMPPQTASPLWGRMQSWVQSHADTSVLASIPTLDAEAKPFESGMMYFRPRLAGCLIRHDRRWLSNTQYLLAASMRLPYADRSRVTVTEVFRLDQLMVHGEIYHLPLFWLLPYTGVLEIEVGLLTLPKNRSVTAYLETLEDLSRLVRPPLLDSLSLAEVLAAGVGRLLDAGDASIHLGFHLSINDKQHARDRAPGYAAAIRASRADRPNELSVIDNRLVTVDDRGTQPVTRHDYMMLRIESRYERDDWMLPGIEDLFQRAVQAALEDSPNFNAAARDLLIRVFQSPDFTEIDRRRVVIAIKDHLTEVREQAVRLGAIGVPRAEHGRSRSSRAAVPPEETETTGAAPKQTEAPNAGPVRTVIDTDVESDLRRRAIPLSEAIRLTHLSFTQLMARR